MIDAIDTKIDLIEMGKRAKAAGIQLARATTEQKNAVIITIAETLEANSADILAANKQDVDEARANGTDEIWIKDRLDLTKRMSGMIADVRNVATLPDPVGKVFDAHTLENGLKVSKRRTPLGVLGVIYEARPNVTIDVAVLAIKSGNAAILRGGKEAMRSNLAMIKVLRETLESCGLPANIIQYIESTERKYVGEMLKLHQYIDLIIPRGGNDLHKFCRENSTIPVITGGIGVCHLFVDESADLDVALPVIHNAKTQRPATCNAVETILVHEKVAAEFLPRLVKYLGKDGVTFHAEPKALAALNGVGGDQVQVAGPDDFDMEWYALVLSLKVVDSLDEAIEHIREHSTQHSDGILTRNMDNANRFLDEVDSAAVYLNASTR
ncbi:MAG: glutamate-5-semialdehyde dehydrogenase, partial [Anaerolineae bacterium]|nr:glutamate-5-semialdehyde dehydrogenase [Anaerolineae bacterium]